MTQFTALITGLAVIFIAVAIIIVIAIIREK